MMVILLCLGVFMSLISIGKNKHLMILIRSLQLILHLPIFQVVMPADLITYINLLISFAIFDILNVFNINISDSMPYLKFNNDI